MSVPLRILIVGADAQLAAECEAAIASLASVSPVFHRAGDRRQAIEMARSRQPEMTIVEMGTNLTALKALAVDLAAASPETLVAAAFRPERFGHDVNESAILIEALRAGVRDFLRRPVSAVDIGQLIDRLRPTVYTARTQWGKLVSYISNKGGVGKSTLAVNTALGLAQRRPNRVLLIDASLQMGVCAAMLDLEPQFSLTDAARERERLDTLLIRQLATLHPSGLHLLAAPADAMEGAEVDDDLVSRVLMLARRAYDFVIVDTFPFFDSVNMAVLDASDHAYIVLESVVPTLLGATKLLKVLDAVGFPSDKQRVILNRYSSRGGSLKPVDVATRLGRDIDHVVPFDRGLITAANLGRPFLSRARRFSRCGRELRGIVNEIERMPAARALSNGHVSTNGKAATNDSK